jgi:hypothetical protein
MQCWYYWCEEFKVSCWDCCRWHDIHTKFIRIGLGIRNHIQLITLTILNVAMLVLLMGGIYEVRRSKRTRWYDIHSKFHDYQFSHSRNMKVIISTTREVSMLVLLMKSLRLPQVTWHTCQVSQGSVQAFKICLGGGGHRETGRWSQKPTFIFQNTESRQKWSQNLKVKRSLGDPCTKSRGWHMWELQWSFGFDKISGNILTSWVTIMPLKKNAFPRSQLLQWYSAIR